MIEKFCRENGMYILMLVVVVAIQLILEALGAVAQPEQPGPSFTKDFQAALLSRPPSGIPLALFGAAVGVLLVLGAGLVTDGIFLMKWFLAKASGATLLHPRPFDQGPWELADLFRLFVLFFFALSCLQAFHAIAVLAQWLGRQVLENIALVASSLGLYSILLIALYRWRRERSTQGVLPAAIGSRPWAKDIAKGLAAYLAFVPTLLLLMFFSLLLCQLLGIAPEPHDVVELLRSEKNALRLAYLGLLTVLIGPIVEEIIFRGVAYSALRKRTGIFGAAAASSMVFALAHTNAAQTLPVFGMGMVLALLYEYTGSLVASMAFHIINNTAAFALTMVVIAVS